MKAQIIKAIEIGACAEGGKWVAICNIHSTLVNADTKKSLTGIVTEEFCDCCRGNCSSYCVDCEKG